MTCHVEDVGQPCENPLCEVHTSSNTPAISRAVSQTDLTTLTYVDQYGDCDDGNNSTSADDGGSLNSPKCAVPYPFLGDCCS